MKCDTCGNSKIWIGDMMTGGLACEHCLNNDDIYKEAAAEIFLSDGSSIHYDPAGGLDITIVGAGGGGGCANVGAIVGHGGSGGAQAGSAPSTPNWDHNNVMKCPEQCCMQGGNGYCKCYGEMPSFRIEIKGEWKC